MFCKTKSSKKISFAHTFKTQPDLSIRFQEYKRKKALYYIIIYKTYRKSVYLTYPKNTPSIRKEQRRGASVSKGEGVL